MKALTTREELEAAVQEDIEDTTIKAMLEAAKQEETLGVLVALAEDRLGKVVTKAQDHLRASMSLIETAEAYIEYITTIREMMK